jgi:flagellin
MMMGIVINTNVQSLNAQRLLNRNTRMQSKSYEKLASGFKINRASDDAAGMQISESLRTQIRGSQRASDNIQDAMSVLTIMDGTMQTVTDNIQRMRELAIQGANDTFSEVQRSALVKEYSQLSIDINRVASATQFNGKTLLNGTVSSYYIQVGANTNSSADRINLANIGGTNPFASFSMRALLGLTGTTTALSFNPTSGSALNAISRLDRALQQVNNRRASLGAMINRLEGSFNNISIAIENISSSESRIRNTDVAKESAELTRNQILQQSSAQILAQANQLPQLAMQLLRGGGG